MLQRLDNPNEIFQHKLEATLKMENTVLSMLGDLQEEAQDENLRGLFNHHADETRQQIQNLEKSFRAFGWEPDEAMNRGIEGIKVEGKANIKMTDDAFVDAVVLPGAAETEHYEIAAYETLITFAQKMGKDDVVGLL